jgi:hypothetical protein
MLLVDGLDEFGLVKVHQLGESAGFGGDCTGLSCEEADLTEDAADCKVHNVGLGLFLKNDDASLYDKEKALALLGFSTVRIEVLTINEFLVIINPILFISLLKYEIIHKKYLLLKHKYNLRLQPLIKQLHKYSRLPYHFANDMYEHFILQILIEHGEYLLLIQLFLLLMCLHLLKIPPHLPYKIFRHFLMHQILINMEYLLLEL